MRTLLPLFTLVFAAALAHGQAVENAPSIVNKTLTVSAVAAPRPSLKYRLLPEAREMTSGNAVQLYYRAMLPESFSHRKRPKIDEDLKRWQSTPLGSLPKDELDWLRSYPAIVDCEAGARRAHCDWEMVDRLRKGGVETRLGDMPPVRELSRLLILKARLELAEGKPEAAVRTLASNFAIARHAGNAPVLICSLIGAACANEGLTEIEELIQTPGAPNLYWALTALPTPLIDVSIGLDGERLMVEATIPEMRIVDRAMTADETGRLLDRLTQVSRMVSGGDGPLTMQKFMLAATAEGLAPECRKRLEAAGFKAELVKQMPAAQAVLIDWSTQYQEILDEQVRASYLPYWQARPRMIAIEKEKRGSEIPLFGQLVPAISRAGLAGARVDRHVAALRTVEALRLYAAQHGKFPAKLADMTETPIPLDPVTGESFEYKLDGEKAILRAPAPTGEEPMTSNSLGYVIVLKK
jgi:hypothetical protein